MTIFQTLRAEHDRMRKLLALIPRTASSSQRREVLSRRLGREWEAHVRAEQASLYRCLEGSTLDGEVAMGQREQEKLRGEMSDWAGMDPDDPNWMSEFEHVKAGLLDHMTREEHSFFQHAGKLLSDGDKRSLRSSHHRERLRVEEQLEDH